MLGLSEVTAEKPPPVPQRQSPPRQLSRLCGPEAEPVAGLGPRPLGRRRWGEDTGLSAGGMPARTAAAPSGQWTAAYQAPPSMGFSRQEYWSGVPLPSLHFTLPANKGG